MTENIRHSGQSVQAVFCICASPDVSSATLAACAEATDSSFVGEFHDYFSPERRPEFSTSLKAATRCVAIVDCDRDPEVALRTIERLRMMLLKNLNIVAYASQLDADFLLRAMRAGCNEFLTKPATREGLEEALLRFSKAYMAETATPLNVGRVITFFGAKGGAGATTLAVHLANNLVRRHRKRTLLLDHHHELGHVALLLGLTEARYHFNELIRNAQRLDGDLLKGFVVRHASGLEVLTSPDTYAADYKSSPEDMQLVMSFLRTQYDYVIVDSSLQDKNAVLSIQQSSDEIYLVSTPDLAALRDLARHSEYLSLSDPTVDKLRIVINRATANDAVTSEQIQAIIHFPVWTTVSNNYSNLVHAINAGEPISPQDRSGFAQQINKWADKIISATIVNADEATTPRKGFAFWPLRRERIANA